MKGTVVMRFVGNRQEPEERMSVFGEGLPLEPPPLPVSAKEFLDEFHDFLTGTGLKHEKEKQE